MARKPEARKPEVKKRAEKAAPPTVPKSAPYSDGVRNFAARNFLRDGMRLGDRSVVCR